MTEAQFWTIDLTRTQLMSLLLDAGWPGGGAAGCGR